MQFQNHCAISWFRDSLKASINEKKYLICWALWQIYVSHQIRYIYKSIIMRLKLHQNRGFTVIYLASIHMFRVPQKIPTIKTAFVQRWESCEKHHKTETKPWTHGQVVMGPIIDFIDDWSFCLAIRLFDCYFEKPINWFEHIWEPVYVRRKRKIITKPLAIPNLTLLHKTNCIIWPKTSDKWIEIYKDKFNTSNFPCSNVE